MRTAAMLSTFGALALTAGAVTPASGSPGRLPDPVPAAGAVEEAFTARGTAKAAERAAAAGIDWTKCPDSEGLPTTVRCGKVTVPLDYAEPDGRKIRLTVSRKRATGPAEDRQGPLLYNPGGPGSSGMGFPLFPTVAGKLWTKLNKAYDFVGYAPRGVGRSAPLSCRDAEKSAEGPHRSPRHPSAAYKRKMNERAAAYARGCAERHGSGLEHFTTPDNARDLDVLRAALGRQQLSFYGASWGTYLGSVYATLFPGHVRRLVLDSVVDPGAQHIWYKSNLDQNPAFERRWTDWKKWVAKHHSVYGLGGTPHRVQRNFERARDALDREQSGGRAGSKELLAGYLDVGYDDSTWAEHASALADFRKGNPKPLVEKVSGDPEGSDSAENSKAVYNAVQCADAPWPRDWSRWNRDNTRLNRTAPFNTWGNVWLNLPCAYWEAPSAQPLDIGAAPGQLPPVLLLASTRDAATPYRGALETRSRLPGSSLVTEKGAGNHGVADGNRCADAHIASYLLNGRTPGPAATCKARPEPEAVYDRSGRGD